MLFVLSGVQEIASLNSCFMFMTIYADFIFNDIYWFL